MKSVKSILIATTLICASVVSGLSAQQAAQPAEQYDFRVALGDSVMIKRGMGMGQSAHGSPAGHEEAPGRRTADEYLFLDLRHLSCSG